MKKLIRTLCSILLCFCVLCNHPLTVLAEKESMSETKGFTKTKFAYTSSLEDAVFPDEETEQAVMNSMTSKEYTDYLYHEAVNFFSTTKIDLDWDHILCVGDSITLGVQTGIEEPYPINYPEILGTLFRTTVDNEGIGGSTIWSGGPSPMCRQVTDYNLADAVFILGGTNDWFYGSQCKLGDLNSPNTFTYDFNLLCENLAERYSHAEIFFIIPMDPAKHMGVELYDDFELIRNVERNIAAGYGFHIIDLPAKKILSALDPATRDTYYSDHCHPNTQGYEILGKIIAYEAIKEMFAKPQPIFPGLRKLQDPIS